MTVSKRFARLPYTVALCAALILPACSRSESAAEHEGHDMSAHAPLGAGWTVTDSIETPESVYYDAASGFIFASQVAGAPDARDGNGRIVKLAGDGTIVSATWATGLNAPKGLRSHGGTLWTADIDEVVGIDMATGNVSSRTRIDGAQFLNDVATGPDGTVYVSDMMANRIYAVLDGMVSVFAEGDQLEWPNGLLVEGNRLIVGGWGRPNPDFSTDVPGRLFALDLQTKQKTLITQEPFANIDGVEADGRGGYIVTDFMAGTVIQVTAGGERRELRQFSQGTADHAFVPGGNVLLVPHMTENRIAAYDLGDALQ